MKKLGIGMVGARYGARMHYANFKKLPEGLVELKGVCASTPENADAFARDAGISFVTTSLDELLERKDIDVIDI